MNQFWQGGVVDKYIVGGFVQVGFVIVWIGGCGQVVGQIFVYCFGFCFLVVLFYIWYDVFEWVIVFDDVVLVVQVVEFYVFFVGVVENFVVYCFVQIFECYIYVEIEVLCQGGEYLEIVNVVVVLVVDCFFCQGQFFVGDYFVFVEKLFYVQVVVIGVGVCWVIE